MTTANETELRENALYAYRLLAEESYDILIVRDPEGTITFVSPALQKLLGYRVEDVLNVRYSDFIHPDDIEKSSELIQVPLPGQSVTVTLRARHADGHYLWLENTVRGIYDHATGRLRNTLSVSRDVTERVQHEMEIKAARERAESASKAKSRFLANMSHELRTPLNAVIGFTDMMRQRTFGPLGNDKYEEYATLIYDSGQLLLDLISDMLDMAKIEAGKLELNIETVDFKGTVEDSVRMLRDRAEENGLELSVGLPADPLFVNADKRAVKQIMLNLLSNALKFTPAGGSVGVSVTAQNGYAVLTVADTGIGIAADEINRLGHPFEQGNGDPMIAKPGSGLGLALVRALTEKHGGSLRIESEEGVGTAVHVSFPLEGPATGQTRVAA
ncbi:PAS domain S-box-containing protein [Rhizomicrobium palustre]|uniref:histidine kinase n=1 Tax=Rhizomicrobium palustre TaxID=189966 RepID=A0A846N2E9_9PROT|nr:PAS domain-containing sensor histidine kinase [Rhizomicrobium palustre]NIK89307.1 PAS domain S-box-containing protein [Rhizomicrobium palustre]